jgi:hypothetical protein
VSQTGGTVGRGVPFPRVHRPELDCQDDIRSISISLGLKGRGRGRPSKSRSPAQGKIPVTSRDGTCPHWHEVPRRSHQRNEKNRRSGGERTTAARRQTRTADRPSDWSATTSPPRPPTPRFGSTVSTRRTLLLPPSPPWT